MIFIINQTSYILLILITLLWELFFTLSGDPSWLVIKALILLLPLKKILYKHLYTLEWVNFIIILFFIEGVVRAWSDPLPSQLFALIEVLLTFIFFLTSLFIFKK
jgi:uncharacterized membrane protein